MKIVAVTLSQNRWIFTLPACDFGMSPNDTNCVNEEVTFVGVDTSGNTIVDWAWDFGDGNTGNGQTVTHTYEQPQSAQKRISRT